MIKTPDSSSFLIVGRDPQATRRQTEEIIQNHGQKIARNNPDLIILEGGEDSLKVEDVRHLLSQLASKPWRSGFKIAVIYQAQKLTIEAQNALLKTLEEPPEKTILILNAINTGSLLPTVVSRCFLIHLGNSSDLGNLKDAEEILRWMQTHNIEEGFAWAQKVKDRAQAVSLLQKLQILGHHQLLKGEAPANQLQRLILAQKYLQANTNTRLTLENLFLN